MTTDDPDRLRREIEYTQRNLSTDVDLLAEKVTPGRIVQRRVGRARRAMTTMRDRVMGTASDGMSTASNQLGGAASSVRQGASSAASSVTEGAQSMASSVSDTASNVASTVAETASQTPQAIRRGTEGNPLAAGLIAFGAGWLLSSLVPASRQEEQAAGQAADWVREHGQPVAAEVAGQVKEKLGEPAKHAMDSVRSTATDAASTVADEARSAAGDVTDRAQEAKSSVQDQRS